jgi:hypothetical protein
VSRVSHVSEVVPDLLDQWLVARADMHEIERAEHPDLTDVFRRSWRWLAGDLYRHDSMVWTRDMVLSPNLRGPSRYAMENPNYRWCARCREVARP